MKEYKKLDQKQVSKVMLHFVWGYFLKKKTNSELFNHFTRPRTKPATTAPVKELYIADTTIEEKSANRSTF